MKAVGGNSTKSSRRNLTNASLLSKAQLYGFKEDFNFKRFFFILL